MFREKTKVTTFIETKRQQLIKNHHHCPNIEGERKKKIPKWCFVRSTRLLRYLARTLAMYASRSPVTSSSASGSDTANDMVCTFLPSTISLAPSPAPPFSTPANGGSSSGPNSCGSGWALPSRTTPSLTRSMLPPIWRLDRCRSSGSGRWVGRRGAAKGET